MLSTLPTCDDVEAAAATLNGIALETPCVASPLLSTLTGADVVMKLENRQHTGSYKMRGAHVKLASLGERARRGVVAASAGNHAQGVAYNAARMHLPSTIVMPETTPNCKIRSTQNYGARVVLHGRTVADSMERARSIAQDEGLTIIPPFDDPAIVAGAGTVGLELLRAAPSLDVLLVQVGGGGLISGVALAAKAHDARIRIIGVQTELYPGLHNARAGLPEPSGGATLAEGVAVTRIGELNRALLAELIDDVVLVDEATIEFAVHLLLEEEKMLVEGAGALGVAALLKYRERFAGQRVGVILSGGNIDTGLLSYVISRVRLREHRVVCVRVEMLDIPGALAQASEAVARCGANVLEVTHRRLFTNVLAKCMQLDLTLEVRRPADITVIVEALNALGFQATLLTNGNA